MDKKWRTSTHEQPLGVGSAAPPDGAIGQQVLVDFCCLGASIIGLPGGDGGAMAASGAVDHPFVVPSASVPRIQEAQTALYHVLREVTGAALAPRRRPPGRG